MSMLTVKEVCFYLETVGSIKFIIFSLRGKCEAGANNNCVDIAKEIFLGA